MMGKKLHISRIKASFYENKAVIQRGDSAWAVRLERLLPASSQMCGRQHNDQRRNQRKRFVVELLRQCRDDEAKPEPSALDAA